MVQCLYIYISHPLLAARHWMTMLRVILSVKGSNIDGGSWR